MRPFLKFALQILAGLAIIAAILAAYAAVTPGRDVVTAAPAERPE